MTMVESVSQPDAASGRSAPAKASRALDPLDLFDIRSELSEDELLVQDTVARFVDDKVLPIIRECFEQHRFTFLGSVDCWLLWYLSDNSCCVSADSVDRHNFSDSRQNRGKNFKKKRQKSD